MSTARVDIKPGLGFLSHKLLALGIPGRQSPRFRLFQQPPKITRDATFNDTFCPIERYGKC